MADTFGLLKDYIKTHTSDVIIIGKSGEIMFRAAYPGKPYIFFEFPDNKIDVNGIRLILSALIPYDTIMVFSGKFQSILSQKAEMVNLYGEVPMPEVTKEKKTPYLFEPDLETIMLFFEREILSTILEQSLYESQLAKQATRMQTLDTAMENIDKELLVAKMKKRFLIHRSFNSKQQNSLAGITLWRK